MQSPSVFARRLLTALWRLVILPLCVTFPTTHTFLKNGLLRTKTIDLLVYHGRFKECGRAAEPASLADTATAEASLQMAVSFMRDAYNNYL